MLVVVYPALFPIITLPRSLSLKLLPAKDPIETLPPYEFGGLNADSWVSIFIPFLPSDKNNSDAVILPDADIWPALALMVTELCPHLNISFS